MKNHRKAIAQGMLVFAVAGWPVMALAGLPLDTIIMVYSLVALVYPAVLAVWFADDEDSDD